MIQTIFHHFINEEQHEGGGFDARIWNESYRDIEESFLRRKSSTIEKIQTIWVTSMAVSGLQTESNDENSLGKTNVLF